MAKKTETFRSLWKFVSSTRTTDFLLFCTLSSQLIYVLSSNKKKKKILPTPMMALSSVIVTCLALSTAPTTLCWCCKGNRKQERMWKWWNRSHNKETDRHATELLIMTILQKTLKNKVFMISEYLFIGDLIKRSMNWCKNQHLLSVPVTEG